MSGESEMTETLTRLKTGNAQLDQILHGGFPQNSINIVMGEPGSGKTILVEQLIFANAQNDGRPILFFTTLSEPVGKVVRFLQQFRFFDEQAITSGSVVYDSLGEALSADGISAIVPRIKEAIKEFQPSLLVIDSFKAIHDLATSTAEMRRMLYDLAGYLSAFSITTFLIGEYSSEQIATHPEFAVADGMIELARQKRGTRDERFLRVLKLRGSGYAEGLHAFRINETGLEVFPRLTSPAVPLPYEAFNSRIPTGVPRLDEMLCGGFRVGSSTLLQGQTGAGKTTVGLQFIVQGLRLDQQCLFVNFQENPTQLARTIADLAATPSSELGERLHLLYASPVELQIDSILVRLFRTIEEHDIKRVVIDSLSDLIASAADLERLYGYLYALVQHFTVRGVTSLITLETVPHGASTSRGTFIEGQVSGMSDCILNLQMERQGDRARRTLHVIKARGCNHDLHVREARITDAGLEVLGT